MKQGGRESNAFGSMFAEMIVPIWANLGIHAVTVIALMIVAYFVIIWAVRNGVKEALKEFWEKCTTRNDT